MSEEVPQNTGFPTRYIVGILVGFLILGVIIIVVTTSAVPPPPDGKTASGQTDSVQPAPVVSTVTVANTTSTSMTTPGIILSSASGLSSNVVTTGDVYKTIVYALSKQQKYTTSLNGNVTFFGLSPAASSPTSLPASGRINISGFTSKLPGATMVNLAGTYVWKGSSDKKTLVIMDLNQTKIICSVQIVGGRFNLIFTGFSTLLTPSS